MDEQTALADSTWKTVSLVRSSDILALLTSSMRALRYYIYCCIVLTLVAGISIPVLLVCGPLNFIYKLIVQKIIVGREGVMMETNDAMWVRDNPKNRFIIHSLARLKGNVSVEQLQTRFEERMIKNKEFYKLTFYEKMVAGLPAWYPDSEFSLANHIFEASEFATDDTINKIVAEHIVLPLPANRSPWQVWMIHYKDGRLELLFRFKHTIADGISLVRIFLECLCDEPVHLGANLKPKKIANGWCDPYSTAKSLLMAVFDTPLMLGSVLFREDCSSFHGQISNGKKHVGLSKPIPMELVKKIKSAQNATVNDVLCSAVGEAFAKYMKTHEIPELDEHLMVFIPVSTKSTSGPIFLQNDFGLIACEINISSNISPRQRLQLTKAQFDKIKVTFRPMKFALTQKLIQGFLPTVISDPIFGYIASKSSAAFSNVPGPAEEVYLCGQPIENLCFFVNSRDNVGVGISILSYAGHVQIGLMVDDSIMDCPQEICDNFNQILSKLAENV